MTDCLLHVGLEKTGSTSLQATLAKNRDTLRSRGVLYPSSLGERSHVRAYIYASESGPDPMKGQFGLPDISDLEAFRLQTAEALRGEFETARPRLLCISNEHCSSRLLARSEIERLKRLIDRFCDRTTVVVYLRAPGETLLSSYSTYLKTGGTEAFRAPSESEIAGKYDHEAILERWAAVFGENALDVRLYESAHRVEGGVVGDFLARLDAEFGHADLEIEPDLNRSIGAIGAALLRDMNRLTPFTLDGKLNPLRGNLHDLIGAFPLDIPYEGDPEICAALDARMSAGVERVRERYFPESDSPLFASRPRPPSQAGDVDREALRLKLMAHLWESKQRQVLELKETLQRARRGRAAAMRGPTSPESF